MHNRESQVRQIVRVSVVAMLPTGVIFLLLFCLQQPVVQANPQQPEAMDAPGVITGTVTNAAGEALTDIAVSAYRFVVNSNPPWQSIRTGTTNALGVYRLPLLPAGIYRLEFRDTRERYITEFYQDADAIEAATEVAVAGNVVAGIDGRLQLGGSITGTIAVVDQRTAASIGVTAHTKRENRWQTFKHRQYPAGTTSFRVGALPAGVYRLCIHAAMYSAPHDLAECFDDVTSGVGNATDIALVAGQTVSNVHFLLGDRGDYAQIAGLATDEHGQPLADIEVRAAFTETSDRYTAYYTKTNTLGIYRFDQMQPATYTLHFLDKSGRYAVTYYADTASIADATIISLRPRAVQTHNITLRPGAEITGQVTVSGEIPNRVFASLYRQQGATWEPLSFAYSEAPGNHYRIAGLPAGVYRVQVSAVLGDQEGTFFGFYGGRDLASAADIALGIGEKRTDVNVAISGPPLSGAITGSVTGDGKPLAGIRVDLYYNMSGALHAAGVNQTNELQPGHSLRPVVYTNTDAAGGYTIGALPDGPYVIRFSDPAATYAATFFNPRGAYTHAQTIRLLGGSVLSNVNTSLVRGGDIAGIVRLRSGVPVSDVHVAAYWFTGSESVPVIYNATTDANGHYRLKAVVPGRYRVGFYKQGVGYDQEEFYSPLDALRHMIEAADVIVVADKTTTGIDLILGPNPTLYLPLIAQRK